MSKYMIDKFIRAVEMSDAAVAAYVADPADVVDAWLAGAGGPTGPTDDRELTAAERLDAIGELRAIELDHAAVDRHRFLRRSGRKSRRQQSRRGIVGRRHRQHVRRVLTRIGRSAGLLH